MNLRTMIRNAMTRYADNVAVWFEGQSRTHAEVLERASRLTNGLIDHGIRKGDRVALLGPNSLDLPEQMIGVMLGGYVRVTCYAHETGDVNSFMLELTDSRVLLCHVNQYAMIAPHLVELTQLEHVWVYGGPVPAGVTSYDDVLAASRADFPEVETDIDDVHVIRFSAGTTGRPKGIVHTERAWLAVNNEYRWVTPQLTEKDAYLVAGALSHAALLWFWQTLEVGGRLVMMKTFEPGEFLRLVEEQRCTVTLVVPTMISALVNHPEIEACDLSSMRCFNYAASPISEATMGRAVAAFGPVLYQLYASSEIPTVTMLQPYQHVPDGTDAERKLMRSAGRPTPSTDVKILDEDGQPVATGEVGEIAAKNGAAMAGLWKDPEGTAARFTPDGYVLTRDMGFLDEDGFVYIADRKEDMIISGGYNIWPAEVENAVAAHPGVKEVCVVGVPHDKWGETPRAYVVMATGAVATEEQIIATTRQLLGPIKKATSVEFVPDLPRSGVGKILRREVRAWHWGNEKIKVGGA